MSSTERQAAPASGGHLVAAQDTLVAPIGLIAVACAVGWLLPRRARQMG